MARSARRPSRPAHVVILNQGAAALCGAIARNPVMVGGTTAFLVALSYVSANALWYQPHFHADAFFATRTVVYRQPVPARSSFAGDDPETTIRLVRPEPSATLVAVAAKPDQTVELVQSVLHDLGVYAGPVDGLTGPATRSAIASYRQKVGLKAGSEIDATLLAELGATPTTAGVEPTPRPAPRDEDPTEMASAADPMVAKIQAGLKAFGNDGIEVDGVIGARTKSAIREFQTLFGLPPTGVPDQALYAKMREVGLTD